MTGWFFYYQQNGGAEKWLVADARARAQILEQQKPAFVTVLNVNHIFSEDEVITPEARAKQKFFGPIYFDFDSDCIEDAIEDAQAMIGVLKNYDVDPECVEIFATGGRGFHFEVPINCIHFDPSKGPEGYLKLPLINKYMAFETQVRDMDLRVYSAGRGRMWRVPGVKRDNGLYKVPVTAQEVLRMNADDYRTICSSPRPPLKRAEPKFAPKWADLYLQCRGKAEKVGPKSTKADEALVKTLGGNWSPTMKQMLTGEAIEPGTGFHKVAIQLAITAHAIGKTQDDFLADAQPLCDTYQGSDSNRYGSPQLRRKELSRMYHYISENPGYAFSVGGLRSVMKKGIAAPDLSDLATLPKSEIGEGEDPEDSTSAEHNGVVVSREGIYVRKDGVLMKKSDLGMSKITGLCSMTQYEEVTGFMVDVHIHGKKVGTKSLWMSDFQSKSALQKACSDGTACSLDLTDQQAGYVMDTLRGMVGETGRKSYQVNREGIFHVPIPKEIGQVGPAREEVLWVTKNEVISRSQLKGEHLNAQFTFNGPFGMDALINSDLMQAPKWDEEDKTEVLAVFRNLIASNDPSVIARIFGWFTSCHFAPWIRRHRNGEFPFLHLFGAAGSGKTTLARIMEHMFVYQSRIPEFSAATTLFVTEARMCATSSIAIILDEYKPGDLGKMVGPLQMLMRHSYSGGSTSKGGVNRQGAQSKLEVRSESLTSPFVLIAEAQETQAAIVERCIQVHMDPDTHMDKEGAAAKAGVWLEENSRTVHRVLSAFGKHLALDSLLLDEAAFAAEAAKIKSAVMAEYGPHARTFGAVPARPWSNMSTVKLGFAIFCRTLERVAGSALAGELKALDETLTLKPMTNRADAPIANLTPRTELCQVISHFALLSSMDADDRHRIVEGRHFIVYDSYVDIRIQHCYMLYTAWARSQGHQPLFVNEHSFMQALRRYRGAVTINPSGSLYGRDGITVPVLRLSRQVMAEDHIQEFYALKVEPDPA